MDFSSLWLFFCSQSQSQQYIKTVKNLGDAWRTLAEEPTTELDQNSTVIETRFDLTQKTTNEIERKCGSEPTSVEMKTNEVLSTESSSPVETEPVRHYRIFSDYGTDFIWRNLDDIRPEEDSHVESEEVLSSFPSSVLGLYNVCSKHTTTISKRDAKILRTTMLVSFPRLQRKWRGPWLGT